MTHGTRFVVAMLTVAIARAPVFGEDVARPNIVFILSDDAGYSDVGCYGAELDTPVLDSLAANGLRFTQFYNSARCWPTRAALLTGYYAQGVLRDAFPDGPGGWVIRKRRRPEWAALLSEFLRGAGYRNYQSGKWHIDGPVLAAGFDRSYHVQNRGNFFSDAGNAVDDKAITPPEDERDYYVTTAIADHAVDCLKEHAAEHPDRPFFHYIAFTAPHFPLQAPQEDIRRFDGRYLTGWDTMREARFTKQRRMGLHKTTLSPLEVGVGPPYKNEGVLDQFGPGEIDRPLTWEDLSEEQRSFQAQKMAIHAAMIYRMDAEIGRVVDQLREMGAIHNTLILYASDNGASAELMVRDGGHDPRAAPGTSSTYLCLGPGFSSACNTPFRRHKVWVHEGGISTPLIAHWPAGIEDPGALRHAVSHVIDFVPTALELAGVAAPAVWRGVPRPPLPGRSLAGVIRSGDAVQRDHLWWLHEGRRAIRVGRWKLVAERGRPWELYDMTSDRAEQEDLAETRPDLVSDMAARWEKQTEDLRASAAN